MELARAFARSLALIAWTAAWYGLRLCLRPLASLAPRTWDRVHGPTLRAWSRGLARIIGMRIRATGEPPRPPFLLVANHQSYLDIIVLWSCVEGDFLSKHDVADWPIFGHLTRTAGTLYIDRTRAADVPRAIGELGSVLARGRGVLVFPEGKSSEGASVLPFRPSIFQVALGTGCPVRCAVLTYTTPPGAAPARDSVCWWGDVGFVEHLGRVLRLPRFEAHVTFLAEPAQGEDRKALARDAHDRIAARFVPATGNLGDVAD